MKTVKFVEMDELTKKLRAGNAVIRVESWMTDEQMGKHIRHFLEQAQGAPVTVHYDVITDDMLEALDASDDKERGLS